MSPAEWDALPWHWQETYLEGFLEEFTEDGAPPQPGGQDDGVDPLSGIGITMTTLGGE
jgi:hypothetical protein